MRGHQEGVAPLARAETGEEALDFSGAAKRGPVANRIETFQLITAGRRAGTRMSHRL